VPVRCGVSKSASASISEEGLLGSKAYVQAHLADVKTMTLKPEHQKIAAYYNLDNGTGRIHGVWMQGNLAIVPIFEEWIKRRDSGVPVHAAVESAEETEEARCE